MVELLWQDIVLIRNPKSALFAYKPYRLNVSYVRFFWAHTPEARALKPCQTAPDYWTNGAFPLHGTVRYVYNGIQLFGYTDSPKNT